ncbi:hypothetical protein L1765_07795 [Microaerobacter geothermalis]|uniref:CdaR family protein n=1 Tax=Microaerobacter geothermalis TaxID=674972 RepID=UPI001EEC55C6|nr:CdaR family protein [Microaerobacter geothermalis]MCF6093871.1 hypothetical protein [Microaerobacter geothermalis]
MDKWLKSNTFVKVVSLLLAVMLWMVVNLEKPPAASEPPTPQETSTTIKAVNLGVKYDKDRFSIVNKPDSVDVILQGKKSLLNQQQIMAGKYQVFIDVTQLGSGTFDVPVSYSGFPEGVKVQIVPGTVSVTIEEKQRKEMPITVELIGSTQEGYIPGQAIVKPIRALVMAPESQLEKVALVKAVVNVDGVNGPITKTVPLKVLDAQGNELKVDVNPAVADVTVPITSPFITIPIKLDVINRPASGYSVQSIKPSFEEIAVFGPLNVLKSIDYYPGPQIDLTGYTSDRFLQLKIPMMDGVTKIEPDFIEILVKIVPTEEKLIKGIPLSINGKREDMNVSLANPEMDQIDVTLLGAKELLKDVEKEDIQAFVDVSNMLPGTYDIPITFNLPNFVEVKNMDLQKVTVMISEQNRQSGTEQNPEKQPEQPVTQTDSADAGDQ